MNNYLIFFIIGLANEMKKAIEKKNNNFKAIYFAFRCYHDQAERKPSKNIDIYISLIL
jgi:predicted transcriptional regulator YdeE